MASLTRVRLGYFLTNYCKILPKKHFNFEKHQQALFHCSILLNAPEQEIKMPSLSPTMTEGKIVKWLKKEGDVINPGDVLCDIETDKAVMSMEIEDEGVLAKIIVPENSDLVKVGSLIAVMVGEGEDWKNVSIGSEIKPPPAPPESDSVKEDSVEKKVVHGPPTIEVKMPSLSPTMTSGVIVKWLKNEGDTVSPGDVLCDIQTDKAVMSMETEEEGILAKILVPDNSPDIQVGTLIALIVEEGQDWKSVVVSSPDSSIKEKKSEPLQESPSGSAVPTPGKREKIYGPAVKALLTTYQLEPGLIKPTGRSNRLLKEDVINYIQDNKIEKKPPKAVSAPVIQSTVSSPSPPAPPSKLNVVSRPVSAPPPAGSAYQDIELTNMRQIIAKRLLQSKVEIPHSYSMAKCDVARLIEAKNMMQKEGVKVSLNDLLVKATALALQIYPKANALYVNNNIKLCSEIDICVAVATDVGLYTPIVKSANSKSVMTVSQEIKELATKARKGKLKPEEFQGGTFTISNLGMFGITHFKAIINPPQCGILAVGGVLDSLDHDLKIRKHMMLSLSYDGRILQEFEAAEFMDVLKYVVENPKLILLDSERETSVSSL